MYLILFIDINYGIPKFTHEKSFLFKNFQKQKNNVAIIVPFQTIYSELFKSIKVKSFVRIQEALQLFSQTDSGIILSYL